VREGGGGAVAAEVPLGKELDLLVICVACYGAGRTDTARSRLFCAGDAEVDSLSEWAERVGAVLEVVGECECCLSDEILL
jgi:hypothetical protein